MRTSITGRAYRDRTGPTGAARRDHGDEPRVPMPCAIAKESELSIAEDRVDAFLQEVPNDEEPCLSCGDAEPHSRNDAVHYLRRHR